MPLSEEEQRIIKEMERHLLNEDRDFVTRVQSETIYRHLGRKIMLGSLGVLIGLVWVIYFLSVSVPAAFAGFLMMLVFALWVEVNIKRITKASAENVTKAIKDGQFWEDFNEFKDKLLKYFRGRFNK